MQDDRVNFRSPPIPAQADGERISRKAIGWPHGPISPYRYSATGTRRNLTHFCFSQVQATGTKLGGAYGCTTSPGRMT
jgi:hypothetical protein